MSRRTDGAEFRDQVFQTEKQSAAMELTFRQAEFANGAVDIATRTVTLSFSSELPVDRGAYLEYDSALVGI